MKRLLDGLVLSGFVAALATSKGVAQQITVDEYGHGTNGVTPLVFSLGPDPTGGLPDWPVLMYTLPFAGVQGDVLMQEPLEPGSPILDVLRFDGNFHLIFYSDSIDGYHAPADTPGPPDPFFPNPIFILEQVGNPMDGLLGYGDYTPLFGEPGYDASNPSYRFISEIPEPGAAVLLIGGLGVLGWLRLRCSSTKRAHFVTGSDEN